MNIPRLADLREDHDLKQQQLADMLHIRQSTYSQYENGQRQIPLQLLIQIAALYHTSIDYILGITDQIQPYPKSKE